MSNLSNSPESTFLKAILGDNPLNTILDFWVKCEQEEEKLRNRDALKNTVNQLTRLYENGQLSKQGYLKALDAILEEKTVTIDAQIADRLDRLMNL